MKITRFWKHFLASACIIGILASGLPAYAAASPAQAAPEALELCNAAATPGSVISLINQIGTVTRSRRPAIVAALNAYNQLDDASKAQVSNFSVLAEAQQILGIQDALAKLSVSYDKVDADWSISTPYVDKSINRKSSGIYPWIYVSENATNIYMNVMFHYIGSRRIDLKQILVRAGDEKYTFDCDTSYDGGYDASLKAWFDIEAFTMEPDEISWFGEWLSQPEVIARFIGWDSTTFDYTLTAPNRQGLSDVIDAYNLLNAATPEVRAKALRNL